jgi:short-subunit dehydrogenase
MANRSDIARALAIVAAAGGALIAARSASRRMREYGFRGQSVLIAGSSRGLGLVLARQLAAEGARITLCARDDRELEIARYELESRGGAVFTVTCDLRNAEEVSSMVDAVTARFGGIDVLINVAGTMLVGPIETMTLEDYHEQMDSNYWSAVNTCYYVVPHMKERGGGRIVNISSIGGKIAVPHMVPYCAGKFALSGFSRGLRAELMKDGIVVTTVYPGLMRTGSPRNAMFKSQNEAEYAWFSISDSLPVISMSAEHAAEDIINAMRRGEVEIVLSVPAKLAALFDQLAPEISGELAATAARFLPRPGGIGTRALRGAESESALTRSPLTALTEKAARENNEMVR